MVFMQVVIGGITRLTESGLSITKWEIVTGTLPPLNEAQWIEEFELYKSTPQYSTINKGMNLEDFKYIYFWEYIHRLWARVMGFVFIVPFIYFVSTKQIDKALLKRLAVVFFLACLAATFGWIMVASGLVERPWVNAYKLSLHLLIAFSVYVSLLWTYFFAKSVESSGRYIFGSLITVTIIFVVFQIFLGGIMAGMKAALVFPTWPDMGSEYIPSILFSQSNWSYENFNYYDKNVFMASLIHFLHRNVAYIILIIGSILSYHLIKENTNTYKKAGVVLVFLLFIQVILGIVTVVKSVGSIPVFWGVVHQFIALFILTCLTYLVFYNRKID